MEAADVPVGSSNRRVLVVGTVPDAHGDLCSILLAGPAGADPFGARSAGGEAEAVSLVGEAAAEGRPFAVVFWNLPVVRGADGLDTVDRIWARDPHAIVVVCAEPSAPSWDVVRARPDVSDRLLVLRRPFDQLEVRQLSTSLIDRWWYAQETRARRQLLDEQVARRTAELSELNAALRQDLAEHRRTESELSLAASVFRHAMDGIMITDARGVVMAVNPAFTALTGYRPEDITGRSSTLLVRGLPCGETLRAMGDSLRSHGCWEGELWNRRRSGEEFLARISVARVVDASESDRRFVGMFSDVTELRRKDEYIQHISSHDQVTGLPNRALLMDRLDHETILARRRRRQFGVMFLDLDRFKIINDSHGHDVGNEVLKEVAVRLRESLRDTDLVARVGGDEFVVLLADLPGTEDYAGVAQRILGRLSRVVTVRGLELPVSASIGIACFPEDGVTSVELTKHADAAMCSAKAAGRGTVRFFRPEMTAQAERRLDLEVALRSAVDRGEFELFYQPKVSIIGGELCGVEALARWRHPQRGLILPAEFIPTAEETGIICDLGSWVLEEACRQSREWRDAYGRRVQIGVNISALQVVRGDLVGEIQETCAKNGISPSDLEIEITESIIMENLGAGAEILARLRKTGLSVAVDDFGTGYSSFAYLRRLPIDVLKIDRSFVMNIDQDSIDREIVNTIITLARALTLSIVAEGVETQSQADVLTSYGCRVAQGYLFSRPLPSAEFEERFLARR